MLGHRGSLLRDAPAFSWNELQVKENKNKKNKNNKKQKKMNKRGRKGETEKKGMCE